MFEKTRNELKALSLPSGDNFNMPTSSKKFPDGSNFKIEIPTVNSIELMSMILEESTKQGVLINRITETYGIFRHTKHEIQCMVKLCQQYGCEFIMSTGPRATNDTGGTTLSSQGKTIAYRLRGQEQIVRAIEDIKRGIDLGVTMFLIYDEGLLWILNKMRQREFITKNIKFKVSAHCGHGNPASLKLLEELGADSINPIRDLQLPMIAALRSSINIPIDCHTDNPAASGGVLELMKRLKLLELRHQYI